MPCEALVRNLGNLGNLGMPGTSVSEQAVKQVQWPVPGTVHNIMVFHNLHNGMWILNNC